MKKSAILKNKPKPFTKLSKKSLAIGNKPYEGNQDSRNKHLTTYEYGQVLIAYDEKIYTVEKPWYLYYTKSKSHTGGFKTKREAELWYEHKGR